MSIVGVVALVALLIFIAWLGAVGWRASRRPKKDAKVGPGMVPTGPSINIDAGGPGC